MPWFTFTVVQVYDNYWPDCQTVIHPTSQVHMSQGVTSTQTKLYNQLSSFSYCFAQRQWSLKMDTDYISNRHRWCIALLRFLVHCRWCLGKTNLRQPPREAITKTCQKWKSITDVDEDCIKSKMLLCIGQRESCIWTHLNGDIIESEWKLVKLFVMAIKPLWSNSKLTKPDEIWCVQSLIVQDCLGSLTKKTVDWYYHTKLMTVECSI